MGLLKHEKEHIRGWAIRLALESAMPWNALRNKLAELAANDPSPLVRLQIASALQRMAFALRLADYQGTRQARRRREGPELAVDDLVRPGADCRRRAGPRADSCPR